MLETPQGPLTESSAIARYLASLSTSYSLYPQPTDATDTTRALIDAWIDWALVLDKVAESWAYPMLGLRSNEPAAVATAKSDFEKALQTLEIHLKSSTFLVGESLTLADLVVISHLLLLYITVCFGESMNNALDMQCTSCCHECVASIMQQNKHQCYLKLVTCSPDEPQFAIFLQSALHVRRCSTHQSRSSILSQTGMYRPSWVSQSLYRSLAVSCSLPSKHTATVKQAKISGVTGPAPLPP